MHYGDVTTLASKTPSDRPTSPLDLHTDYPHQPGTLYDCPACEATCFCTDRNQCAHCAIEAEGEGDPS